MSKQLDQIVVVDIEATCWASKQERGDQQMEIIEVGICVLDVKTGKRVKKESIIVKPVNSTVSEYCTELTSLTQEDVDKGISFEEACAHITKTYGRKRTWASWGDYDRRQFERECKSKGVKYPFGITHLNVKNLFALREILPREVGMEAALKYLGEELEGIHHRGIDDANNIALILSITLQE